ncbi:MAG: dsDNA nuclease domain-containing protein [Shewanella sp.]|uniref:dsDNA nuclease domain-containing protein n=1 Tax=Aeromonas veronii TaxID=654 RepID=UPI0038E17F93
MGLAKSIIDFPQTERGGEIAQRGFDFQACWAISHMLEYELKGKEYVFVFEYHDDVLIFDSESSPQKATFAQVKTNEKPWTLSKLITATKRNPISFIGKLFEQKNKFYNSDVELMFVSNAYFSFDERNKFKADEMKPEFQTTVRDKISKQLSNNYALELSKLTFLTTDLSLEDHSSHLKGKICDFFETYFDDDIKINPASFARTLESAYRDRAKVRSSDIRSYDELIKRKGFTSSFVKDTLNKICATTALQPDWENARDIFLDIGKSTLQLLSLRSTFTRISISVKSLNSVEKLYLENANLLFDKGSLDRSVYNFINESMRSLEISIPDYSLALTEQKKECIIVYSILKNIIGGDE